MMPGGGFGGRGGMAPGLPRSDVDTRLRDVEAKLDRLLKVLEKPPPAGN